MFMRDLPFTSVQDIFASVAGQPFAHLFTGGNQDNSSWGGEWAFLVARPSEFITVHGGNVYHGQRQLGAVADHDPLELLRHILQSRRQITFSRDHSYPPFLSGAVGHLTYEMAGLVSGLPSPAGRHKTMPDMAFGFYDGVIACHKREKICRVFATSKAKEEELMLIAQTDMGAELYHSANFTLQKPEIPDTVYQQNIETIIERILAGDVFQANLTRRVIAQSDTGDQKLAWQLYKAWIEKSVSSYACLLQYDQNYVLSNSPERFFNLAYQGDDWQLTVEPIKGTRRRAAAPAKDKTLAQELYNSEKDRAENIMIVDLMRNDLSKICRDYSIKVEELAALRSYAHVHHLVSTVTGALRDDMDSIDILRALFPSGSITGAPKESAMQIIAEQEQRRRGVYCGTIGFIDDRGNAEFSVPIRTAELHRHKTDCEIEYGTGGGITNLSKPGEEFMETHIKAYAFQQLLGGENA
ncbi:MAG: anthranilate synthase component I family protein [bacterium]